VILRGNYWIFHVKFWLNKYLIQDLAIKPPVFRNNTARVMVMVNNGEGIDG